MRAGEIDAYLAELAAALRGPRRAKADLLTEARDSLVDATEAYEHEGHDRESAERAAVRDFGTLDEVVPGYQAELGWARARHTSLLILFVFAAQPFVWGIAFQRVTGTPAAAPGSVADGFVEDLGGITILVALLAVLAHRIGMRRPAVRDRITRSTGIAGVVVSTVFVALGVLLTAQAGVNPLWTAGFLVAPMAWIAASAGRCLTRT